MTKNILHFQAKISAKLVKKEKEKILMHNFRKNHGFTCHI